MCTFIIPFLAQDNGNDFLEHFYLAADGAPFILVIEGSIPNEGNKMEGYWASMGTEQSWPTDHQR
jgi:hydrogenase small subunit